LHALIGKKEIIKIIGKALKEMEQNEFRFF